MLLFVIEDHHAERALRGALAAAETRGEAPVVLTTDALLAMRLRRDGVDARLTTDGLTKEQMRQRDGLALDGVASAFRAADRDASAFLGTSYGRYLEYTLIPSFIRAVRNLTAIDGIVETASAAGSALRLGLVGGGPLVDAARLLAGRRGIAVESFGGDLVQRAAQLVARLRCGRATRWVNTDFRALVLEPGFIWLLFLKGLWRRLTTPAPAPTRGALLVVGDRFTADVVERLRESRAIVLTGATQPGRALFARTLGLVPIEAFTQPADPLRWLQWIAEGLAAAFGVATDRAHGHQLVVAGVPYWPLVGRSAWLHLLAWTPALRHLQALSARAARACPDSTLLASSDVTAYNRVLIDTVRGFDIASIGIQHGILGQANGHSTVHVDRLATWGEESERWYREQATQRAQFVVTGNPRFDALAGRIAAANPEIRNPRSTIRDPQSEIFNPQSRRPFTVTVCTGFVTDFSVAATEYVNLMMLQGVIEWARRHPGTTVIHKMHPGEEDEYYARAAAALGWDPQIVTIIKEPILYDVLERSDVLVAEYSTTVLESIVLGTPAIVLDAIVRSRLLPLDEIAGIQIAFSIDELHAQLSAHLGGTAGTADRNDPVLARYIGLLDGGAAGRIASLVSNGRTENREP